ncbi:MAG: BspA family leucine-rich repeat surface protein [Methylococcales symbiont of Iophon sp. n. MRB-2018]|nr:MAG: BspA family leucine-rich repeat surface protein [Methylococcales symbiont of Iophon sp. n. MRB-2018]KAF3979464.1 MAG: BspA family leucine-rich repeat surface protein [Methylococcales symbiont of Iophon sp. n. MRB-2018]
MLKTNITRRIVTPMLLLLASGFLFSTASQASSHESFNTEWRMPANDLTLTFPSEGSYTIKWGDGTTEVIASSNPTHDYATAGDYTVTVSNTITRFNLSSGMDREKLIDVQQWGTANWTSMEGAFHGANAMMMSANDSPDLSGVTSMRLMFAGAAVAVFNQNISNWNVASVTNMSSMFADTNVFNQDIGGWNVASVTDMAGMFDGASDFNQDIGSWNVASVTNMNQMFFTASDFNQDIGSWNVARVTDMNFMFSSARAFNQDIGGWNVASVMDMASMFTNANVFNQNLGRWYVDETVADLQTANSDYGGVDNLNVLDFNFVAQNAVLSGQNPTYTLATGDAAEGSDNARFALVSNTLSFNSGMVADGTYTVRIAVDNAEFGTSNSIDFTVAVGLPAVTSIMRTSPTAETTSADTLIWTVTFSRDVQNVDGTDFTVSGTTATATVTGSGAVYLVNVTGGNLAALNGTVTLAFASNQNITDTAGRILTNTTPTDTDANQPSYTLDHTVASLSALTLSAGTLDPVFASGTIDYDVSIANAVTSLTVTPTLSDSNASFVISGTAADGSALTVDANGRVSGLSEGNNTISIVVTAGNDTSIVTYTVTVTNGDSLNAAAEEQVLDAILPQLLRATSKMAVDNISNRIDQALSTSPTDTANVSLNLGGSSNLQELINNNARTVIEKGLNLKQMLNNSSFLIPLNVAGDNDYGVNNMTLWGSGDYLNLADDVSGVDWEGGIVGGTVGIDARINQDLVAGAAFSYSESDVDYKRDSTNNSEGNLNHTLYSVHPYIAYDLSPGGRVWGTLGYGQGEVEIDDDSNGIETKTNRDTELYSLAFGGSDNLLSSDNWLDIPGTTTLRLKGEVSLSNIKVGKSKLTDSKGLSIDARRYRMVLEGSHKHTLASGASISPSIELGIRYDDGSGETGGGIELAGSYRYSNLQGLQMELRAHGLVAHESNYKEWGLSGLVKYQANNSGQGLWLSLQPAWGDTPDNVGNRIGQRSSIVTNSYENGVNDANDEDNNNNRSLQLNTELGYGLPGFFGRGLLSPYAGANLTNGTQSYNIGGRWTIDSILSLNLIGERREKGDSIELRGDFKF